MKQTADICLLLEGTYPFVRGGVSSWLHQLIGSLKERTFALVFLGGRRADYAGAKYVLPSNVVHLETHFLEDALRNCPPQRTHISAQRAIQLRALHDALKALAARGAAPSVDPQVTLECMLRSLECEGGLHLAQFLYSAGAWEILCDAHLAADRETPFLDYFWTVRLLHAPLFQLAAIAGRVPSARVYHSISTGYAGFLGALLERRRRRPLILSEHGIYTKERRIDLNQAEWFEPTRAELDFGAVEPRAPLRELWIRYFESLGRIAYRSADPIIALYEGSRRRQLADGALAERTRVIANGIDAAAYQRALLQRPAQPPMVIGLIGRVVPIKDVKTFIRAISSVNAVIPRVQGWVIGSADEDPHYAAECASLVRALGLERCLKFLGHQDLLEVLPKLGLVMLTSISEGQPLAILEAFAAGVPCVATDVGACRELIEGSEPHDRTLGQAGRVVPFADTEALAQAAIELLSQPEAWQLCQFAGLARVRRSYAQASMVEAYREIYREALSR
jgi:glycosyltransferase involved in cell wall biosynthesis